MSAIGRKSIWLFNHTNNTQPDAHFFFHGDFGLKRAIQKLYDFKDMPNEKQINKIVKKWSPYKSYGCLALWRSIDI